MKYEILGDNLPVVVCRLDDGEAMFNEGGSMSWMSPNMKMETTTNGGAGRALGRMFAGEKFFQNIYTAENGEGLIAFSSSFPGSIKAFEITPDNEIVLQKKAFLAGETGVELSVHLNKKLGVGLFGGEGFIMEKVSGSGIVFAEFDGHVVEYILQENQQLVVDTGHVAAIDMSVSMDIKMIEGAKNIFFGGEGLFLTTLTGPGHVWLQTMPLSNVARVLRPYFPSSSSSSSQS